MNNQKQLFGYIAAGALALGTFLPAITLPIVGSMNYFNNGKGDGVFVLVAAIVAAILVAVQKYKFVLIPALLAAAITLFDLFNFFTKISEVSASLEGNPFAALAGSIQLEWGWFVMILAEVALILIALGVLPKEKPTAE